MKNTKLFSVLKWFASVTGFIGAMMLALNIDISKYAYLVFLSSSTVWMYAGYIMKEYSLVFVNVGFTAVNLIGVYRWLF